MPDAFRFGIIVTLAEILHQLDRMDPSDTIYVAHPWGPSSFAIVARENKNGSLPVEARRHLCRYFLDVAVARAFLIGWRSVLDHEPTAEEICIRLIDLATDEH
jgi:hypothetical protein